MGVGCNPPDKIRKGLLTSSYNPQAVLQERVSIARLIVFRFLPEKKLKGLLKKNLHIQLLQGGGTKGWFFSWCFYMLYFFISQA